MHVQVGVVGGPDGDQVPVGTQVRLQVAHRLPVALHREAQLGVGAGGHAAVQAHVVAVDRGEPTRRGQRSGASSPAA